MSLDQITRPDTRPAEAEPGDHDKFAHYADKNKVTEAMVTGIAIVALCGKKWVPTRDAKDFPVCPDCQRLYELTIDDLS